jgi:hypothetical protein
MKCVECGKELKKVFFMTNKGPKCLGMCSNVVHEDGRIELKPKLKIKGRRL